VSKNQSVATGEVKDRKKRRTAVYFAITKTNYIMSPPSSQTGQLPAASTGGRQSQWIILGAVAAAATVSFLCWYLASSSTSKSTSTSTSKKADLSEGKTLDEGSATSDNTRSNTSGASKRKKKKAKKGQSEGVTDEKALHSQIEEYDKQGKAFFKDKQVSKNDWIFLCFEQNVFTDVLSRCFSFSHYVVSRGCKNVL
jgi:hypothetical protein